MNRFSAPIAAGILATAACLAPGVASAALITFNFTADFSAAGGDLIGAGFSSSTLSGSYTFDDGTADADGSAGIGSYLGALTSLSFADNGSNNTGTATNGDIRIVDGGTDSYRVFADTGDGLTGATNAAGYTLDTFTLNLADNSGAGFANDSLPTTPPSLAAFPDIQSITLGLLASDNITVNNAIYTITSLTLDSGTGPGPGPDLPEPASMLLLLSGLAGVGWAGRGKRSSRV